MPALHELMLDKDQAAALGPHDDDRDLDADEVRRVGLAGASFPVLLLAPDGTRCRGTTGAIRLRHDNDGPQLVSVWRLVEGCPAAPEGATVVGVRDTGETSGCAAFSVREVAAAEATHTSHGDPTFGPQRCHEPRCEVRTRATRSAAGPGSVVQLLHWSIADVTRPRCEWTGDERLETWVEAPARVERLPLQLRLVAAIGDAHGPAYAVGVDRGAYQVVDIRRPAPAPVRTYTSHHEEEPGYTLRPQCGG